MTALLITNLFFFAPNASTCAYIRAFLGKCSWLCQSAALCLTAFYRCYICVGLIHVRRVCVCSIRKQHKIFATEDEILNISRVLYKGNKKLREGGGEKGRYYSLGFFLLARIVENWIRVLRRIGSSPREH